MNNCSYLVVLVEHFFAVPQKASTFEPWGSKNCSKYGYFHPPGCEIDN